MLTTVEGIFDGQYITLLERVRFNTKRKVLVTFLEEASPETALDDAVDPIQALRGSAKELHLTEKLLKSRKEDQILEARSQNA